MSLLNPIVYLDHNATTPPCDEAVAAMVACLRETWANPSSMHGPGQAARRLLAQSREAVARFLGCLPAELVFTSGATEANHLAVLGALARGRAQGRNRLVLSAVEHPGLLALATRLQAEGTPVTLLPVDAHGRLNTAAARAAIGPDVALLSVMGANNETGVLMPIAELAALTRAAGTLLHVDATQWVGKAAVRFDETGADLWSVSAHKLHGPKGTGALVVRKALGAWPALLAGKQERHRRGGTENLPGIAGWAAACEALAATQAHDLARQHALQQRLEAGLTALADVHIVAGPAARLPNTTCVRFGTLDAEQVLARLEQAGVVASSGAACTAGGTQPSHVLLAMGEPPLHARAAVRLSLGRGTTAAHIDHLLATVQRAIVPLLREAAAVPL